tara:strand:+ start:2256 stop:2597 length:342 start_codon:yes stop_codon:yes gene_type:complete
MATGDYSVFSGEITTAIVAFQPSAGVETVLKTCTAEFNSSSHFVSFEHQGEGDIGYGATAASRAMRFQGAEHGARMGTLYFNCTIFMDNDSYVAMDGVGATGKGYYAASVQIS